MVSEEANNKDPINMKDISFSQQAKATALDNQ